MAQALARQIALGLPSAQKELSASTRTEVLFATETRKHRKGQNPHAFKSGDSQLRLCRSTHESTFWTSKRRVLTGSKRSDATAERKEAVSTASSYESSNGRPSTEALIAIEAANHFQQFDTLLTVVGGYDRAVNAEVTHSGPAQSFENGTWPVLLGLAEVRLNGANPRQVPSHSSQASPMATPLGSPSLNVSTQSSSLEGLATTHWPTGRRDRSEGTSAKEPAPLKGLGLRALESVRALEERGLQFASALLEGIQGLGGSALPLVQRASREGRLVAAAVVFALATSTAVPLARRAHSHNQQVQTAAARRAAEEHSRELQGTVVDLHADNFVPVLTTRPTIVKFYTDWCPYCKQLVPTWDELAKRIADKGLNVQVAKLNADVYSEPVMDLNLKGFPSLVLFQGTKPILNYTGPRDLDALLGVVEASYSQMS